MQETKKPLIVYGRSLGGAVAIKYANQFEPTALIVDSSFSSLYDMATHLYPFLPAKLILNQHFDSFKKVINIKCPKLFLHSPNDEVIPFKLGQKLFDSAPEPKKFFTLQGGHNEGWTDFSQPYGAVKDFLKANSL